MTADSHDLALLGEAFDTLQQGFAGLPGFTSEQPLSSASVQALLATAARLQDNYPYQHPNYAGQMLKPPHPLARLAYQLALWINPNNHALDGGRASSAMEKEAVARIAGLFDWQERHLGHLCGGGTVANMEALWVARERTANNRQRVVASAFSHFTHERLSAVLRLPFTPVRADAQARMNLEALEAELKKGDVGTVVATVGSTAYGSIDALADIVALRQRYEFRLHVDAAYGGFFSLLDDLAGARHFAAITEANSVVIDPHKHGLQPYGCGCVLFAEPADGEVYAHDSPYTYFTSNELHLGEISLECSRAGASAVALWATQQALPYERGGEFAKGLAKSVRAASRLYDWLDKHSQFVPLLRPELDLVVWTLNKTTASAASAAAKNLFAQLAKRDIHIALVSVPADLAAQAFVGMQMDESTLSCLRVCLMKPEHDAWLDGFTDQLAELV